MSWLADRRRARLSAACGPGIRPFACAARSPSSRRPSWPSAGAALPARPFCHASLPDARFSRSATSMPAPPEPRRPRPTADIVDACVVDCAIRRHDLVSSSDLGGLIGIAAAAGHHLYVGPPRTSTTLPRRRNRASSASTASSTASSRLPPRTYPGWRRSAVAGVPDSTLALTAARGRPGGARAGGTPDAGGPRWPGPRSRPGSGISRYRRGRA